VSFGAPLFAENSAKETPCDNAEKAGHAQIALYLESKMVFSVSFALLYIAALWLHVAKTTNCIVHNCGHTAAVFCFPYNTVDVLKGENSQIPVVMVATVRLS